MPGEVPADAPTTTIGVGELVCLGYVSFSALARRRDVSLRASIAVLTGEGVALVVAKGCPLGVFKRQGVGDEVPMFEFWFGPRMAPFAIPAFTVSRSSAQGSLGSGLSNRRCQGATAWTWCSDSWGHGHARTKARLQRRLSAPHSTRGRVPGPEPGARGAWRSAQQRRPQEGGSSFEVLVGGAVQATPASSVSTALTGGRLDRRPLGTR